MKMPTDRNSVNVSKATKMMNKPIPKMAMKAANGAMPTPVPDKGAAMTPVKTFTKNTAPAEKFNGFKKQANPDVSLKAHTVGPAGHMSYVGMIGKDKG